MPIDALSGHGVLVLDGVLVASLGEQRTTLSSLKNVKIRTFETNVFVFCCLTDCFLSSIALTQFAASIVHGLTVSVRPSRNRRVMLAS